MAIGSDGTGEARLDNTDLRILSLVHRDARLSARALGREIGMSPGAVSERVQRLERAGVIRGYHADVDPAALGYRMRVLVALAIEQGPPVNDTIQGLLEVPEVVAIHVVSGQWDLIVVAQVRDERHLRDLVLGGLWGVPGFRHSDTMLILDSHESTGDWIPTVRSMDSQTN